MNPLVRSLFGELADLPAGERERFFAERQIAPEVRAELESLLRFDLLNSNDLNEQVLQAADEALGSEDEDASISSLDIGDRLGSYEITALLGRGGMGEVYRARDAKLRRDVAIKVLPEEFSTDRMRLARFQREAEALAALNHPNIAGIYDLQQSGTMRFLVLELVEGPTLADMLKQQGALPIEQTVHIGKQICEALEAAHEKGIVHRDLKPANVKITPDEKAKVLDFGLAKALETVAKTSPNSPSPATLATREGMLLGTPAYMSPEQAKGRMVDRRADIFAFGCVLYEMLTGRRAFDGEHVSEIVGRVVTIDPDWDRLPPGTPPSIRRLLQRALKKDPRHRLSDIHDAWIELDEAETESGVSPLSGSKPRGRLLWIGITVTVGAVVAAGMVARLRHVGDTTAPEIRVEITTPTTPAAFQFALSPDGQHIVFVASGDGPRRLWLRSLNRVDPHPLAGTNDAELPFWSADSRSIGYFASGKLYRVELAGGPPQFLANAPRGYGGAWNAEGTILFTPSRGNPIFRVPASGGDSVPITLLDPPRQVDHRFPRFLADGRHFLFYVVGTTETTGIYIGSLEGGVPKRLTPADTTGEVVRSDTMIFIRQGALVARRLDLARQELTGDQTIVAEDVGLDSFLTAGFSVSGDGKVAYRVNAAAGREQLTWFDRTGKIIGAAGAPDPDEPLYPELSPDERQVALARTLSNNSDIWLMDLVRGSLTRFTFEPNYDNYPLWSPDGTRIVFRSDRKSPNLYVKPSSGATAEELLLESPNVKVPQDWSRDGRFLLYYELDPKTGRDLFALPMTGTDRSPRVVANTPFDETLAQFSPDSRWVAYQTNESGRFEVVVKSFPDEHGKWEISTKGGSQPRWRADGRELYFIAPDGKLMAASIKTIGSMLETGTPIALFSTGLASNGARVFNKAHYAVSRDGRFLIPRPVEESTTPAITLMLNWKPDLKK